MKIEKLYIYPIKSCGGIECTWLNIMPGGPAWDRNYVLVDANGTFLSQRTVPRMCLIKLSFGDNPQDGKLLLVEAPNMMRHFIPVYHGDTVTRSEFKERNIMVQKDECIGIDLGDSHAKWFSAFLGQPCRLVKQVSHLPRIRKPSSLDHETEVSFADGYPLLVTTVESLDDLNRRIIGSGEEPVPMDRFRPNIVLSGCHPYSEDKWSVLKNGDVELEGANKCVRCRITTVNQNTGECGKEPLRTLATYRRNPDGGVEFGRNFVVANASIISIRDKVTAVV